jgi:hypothetical protein
MIYDKHKLVSYMPAFVAMPNAPGFMLSKLAPGFMLSKLAPGFMLSNAGVLVQRNVNAVEV